MVLREARVRFSSWLLCDPGGNIAIDPVEMNDENLAVLEREGVARIVLTNRNHTRASTRLRARTGAPIAIHPADADYAREQGTTIDEDLVPGQRVGPLEVIAVPGKSPGEVALLHRERRILWVGDACVGKPPGSCALLAESVIDEPATLRASLARLAQETDFDALLVCDGDPVLTGGREALQRLVLSRP